MLKTRCVVVVVSFDAGLQQIWQQKMRGQSLELIETCFLKKEVEKIEKKCEKKLKFLAKTH